VGLGWALFCSYLLIPQFALARPGSSHYGLGATTAAVGLLMVPLAAGQTVAGPLAGLVSRRASPQVALRGRNRRSGHHDPARVLSGDQYRPPAVPAFTLAFLMAAGFCVAGAALIIAFGRNGRKAR
jgi:hypothetical protein